MQFFTEIRGAQWKLHSGYFALWSHKEPRAHGAPQGEHSVPQLLHSGIRGTQKYPKTHFSQTCPSDCSQPMQVPPKGVSQSPHGRAVTKAQQGITPALVGQQAAGLGQHSCCSTEGLCSTWNTLTTVLSFYSSVLTLQGIFVFIQYHLISCHT